MMICPGIFPKHLFLGYHSFGIVTIASFAFFLHTSLEYTKTPPQMPDGALQRCSFYSSQVTI